MHDDDDAALTTREMLMALEEMPPETGYMTMVRGVEKGPTDPAMVIRLGLDDVLPYAMLVANGNDQGILRGFPDRDTFVMTVGSMTVAHKGGAWFVTDDDSGEQTARDLRNAVKHARTDDGFDFSQGLLILIDYVTGKLAVVQGKEGLQQGVKELSRMRGEAEANDRDE